MRIADGLGMDLRVTLMRRRGGGRPRKGPAAREELVVAQRESTAARRLEMEGTPHTRHRGLAHANALGELAGAPVRRTLGKLLECRADQLLDAIIGQLAMHVGVRSVRMPSSRRSTKRCRHLLTVWMDVLSSRATSVHVRPAAHPSTIRARLARAYKTVRPRAQRSSVCF
jgi:hypothetical protein